MCLVSIELNYNKCEGVFKRFPSIHGQADEFTKANVGSKLTVIAEQMQFLQNQARKVSSGYLQMLFGLHSELLSELHSFYPTCNILLLIFLLLLLVLLTHDPLLFLLV